MLNVKGAQMTLHLCVHTGGYSYVKAKPYDPKVIFQELQLKTPL